MQVLHENFVRRHIKQRHASRASLSSYVFERQPEWSTLQQKCFCSHGNSKKYTLSPQDTQLAQLEHISLWQYDFVELTCNDTRSVDIVSTQSPARGYASDNLQLSMRAHV